MSVLSASVDPLRGKHYGTTVRVVRPDGDESSFRVWVPHGPPSDEELASWGLSRDMWDRNEEVENGWDGMSPCREVCGPFDSHYQSQLEAKIAARIAWALDGWQP